MSQLAGANGGRPQDVVERALSLSKSDDCVVIADETSNANLRWAGNTLTTNGVARSRRLTVIAIDRHGDGAAAGVVSRAGVTDDQIEDVVRAAEKEAASSAPAEDAAPLPGPEETGAAGAGAGWSNAPERTGIGVLADFAAQLGEALRAAGPAGQKLYGFAEHELTSTFLGSSSGLRLRHDQPTGKVELNAKSADLTRSAWAGEATRDFAGVDVARAGRRADPAAGLGPPQGRAPGGPVRDAAAAHGRLGPAHLPVLVRRGQGRRGRPHRVQQARRRHPGR